jgi:hypothetical protein
MINAGLKINSSPLANFNTNTLAWDNILVTVVYPAESTQNITDNGILINDVIIDTSGSVWKITNVQYTGNFDFVVSVEIQNKVPDDTNLPNIGDTTASINTLVNDQVAPYWNSTYVNANVARIASEFNNLHPIKLDTVSDVTLASLVNGQILKFNGSTWVNSNFAVTTELSTLTDVQFTNIAIGNFLKFNGASWVNSTLSISDLTSSFTINNPLNGHVLQFSNNKWININNTLDDVISDVTITNPINDQILQYTGTEWINRNLPSPVSALSSLTTDVAITSLNNHQVLKYNGSKWVNTTLSLTDLTTDVTISSPSVNQVLQFDGLKWINAALPAKVLSLSGLTSDVTIATPVKNQVLKHNGTKWINSDLNFKVTCLDWNSDQFTAPPGWTVQKVYSDTALQITHDLNSTPTGWSGINTSTSPNIAIVPSLTRNMQIDSANQITFLQIGTLSSFKLYLQFE